jgi:hypothetical protein
MACGDNFSRIKGAKRLKGRFARGARAVSPRALIYIH